MKAILKSKKNISLLIKLTVAAVLITVISILISLKYVGKNKKEYPELITDTSLPLPQCSYNGGFYNDQITITFSSSVSNTKVYYTLDGSEPSLQSKAYTKPIIITDKTKELSTLADIPTSPRWKPAIGNILKGTVIRAICVTTDDKKSRELIRTFFINEKGAKRFSFPVIALTVNPDDLFGHKNGIYVMGKNYEDKSDYIRKNLPLDLPWWKYPSNYLKRGNNAERQVYVEFYEPSGKLGFNVNAGIRINGSATRGFAQKSLRISFNRKYGIDPLNYKLFPEKSVVNFNSFILRNSGNDWNKTMFRDAFMQSLMVNSKLDIQAYRPAIVFINAEYWGIHNIRERFDENYLANNHTISRDSITILELNGDVFHGKKGDSKEFTRTLAFFKTNNMALKANYNRAQELIDIDNLIDYIIANVYFCNSDWPNNNVKFWRYKTSLPLSDSINVKDGRWRWVLSDTDWGFGYTGEDAIHLNLLEKARKTGSIGVIFEALLKNKDFTNQFLLRFDYHLKNTFKSENVIGKIDLFQKTLTPEIQEHINRWRVIGSFSNWQNYVQELKNFASLRPTIQVQQLNNFIKKQKQIIPGLQGASIL